MVESTKRLKNNKRFALFLKQGCKKEFRLQMLKGFKGIKSRFKFWLDK